MLHGMGVQWVVVPAMTGVLSMWTGHFGYAEFRWAALPPCAARTPSSALACLEKARSCAPCCTANHAVFAAPQGF